MAEPVSLAEAKAQLRVTNTREDALISGYIVTAREWVENHTGLILARREVTERIPTFGPLIPLLAWPIADEPVTVSYFDQAGAELTVAGAAIRAATRPARLVPAAGDRWPISRVSGAISVKFTAGFATAAEVPQSCKQAILLLLTAYYEDREGGETLLKAERSARSMLTGFRQRRL